jgi:hypothetical protein
MRGHLQRPYRPLQVIGVLAAVLPVATTSFQSIPAAERAERAGQRSLAAFGERLNANPIDPPFQYSTGERS